MFNRFDGFLMQGLFGLDLAGLLLGSDLMGRGDPMDLDRNGGLWFRFDMFLSGLVINVSARGMVIKSVFVRFGKGNGYEF